jgi:hypothetical protein
LLPRRQRHLTVSATGGRGRPPTPAALWTTLRNRIGDWTDLDPSLVGAVERLIDFVTEPG